MLSGTRRSSFPSCPNYTREGVQDSVLEKRLTLFGSVVLPFKDSSLFVKSIITRSRQCEKGVWGGNFALYPVSPSL